MSPKHDNWRGGDYMFQTPTIGEGKTMESYVKLVYCFPKFKTKILNFKNKFFKV